MAGWETTISMDVFVPRASHFFFFLKNNKRTLPQISRHSNPNLAHLLKMLKGKTEKVGLFMDLQTTLKMSVKGV